MSQVQAAAPSRHLSGTKSLAFCAFFAALISICTFIRIPIPPVPITLQLFATILAGLLLGPKLGMLSCAIYVLLGLLGLPIFTGGGGIQYVVHPTFGFLVGFILGTGLTGWLAQRLKNKSILNLCLVSYAGLVIVYLLGVPYYLFIMNIYMGKSVGLAAALMSTYVVFIPGDIIKCILASIIAKRLLPEMRRF